MDHRDDARLVPFLGTIAIAFSVASAADVRSGEATRATRSVAIVGEAAVFAPGVASTEFAEVRLTLSPDGRTALWFARDRPGGAGGYDIWMSRRTAEGWQPAV